MASRRHYQHSRSGRVIAFTKLAARSIAAMPFSLIVLSVLTGVIAGYGAVAFRRMIGLFHNIGFFGKFSFEYHALKHTVAGPWGPMQWAWGPWVIAVPIVGAVIVAFLVKTFAPEAKGHGVPEVMDAIYYNRSVIRPVVAAIKALASSLSIGTGGAVGREGPIVQIGAAFGSAVGTWLPMRAWQRATLIACGAAGGIAATFNTPVGGVLFAVELIMPEISARTLIPVTLASGAATAISRAYLGNHPAFHIPPLVLAGSDLSHMTAWAVYAVFGIVLGLWSVLFIRSIYAAEDWFDLIPGGYYVRHVIGMALVGVLIYLVMRFTGHYYVEGVGYSLVQDVLANALTAPVLLASLVVLKLLATCLTLGSGGSGGVFSPSLCMGAALGGAYAWLAQQLFPGLGIHAVSMAVIGMAGVVGGATSAVVTAIVMVYEMTRDYQVIIPLLITVSIAYGIRRLMMDADIYDLKLRRRGHFIPNVLQTNLYLLERARDAVSAPLLRVRAQPDIRRLRRVVGRRRRVPHLVIVDQGSIKAVIPASAVRTFTDAQALADAIAHHERMRYVVLSGDDVMFDVVGHLRDADCEVAVLTDNGKLGSSDDVRGVLTMADITRGTQLPRNLLQTGNGHAGSAYRGESKGGAPVVVDPVNPPSGSSG